MDTGSNKTHEALIRKIANKAHAAVVFVNFTPSPEAKYPVAIEQAYAVLKYLNSKGASLNIDGNRIAVAGDSVGGNMATVLTLMAKDRNGPKIKFQALFYPVTDANFATETYTQFGKGGYFLTTAAMEWFWNAYAPVAERSNIYISPLKASLEHLKGLPDAFVATADFDVLRSEGESYASRLSDAGVKVTRVRYLGTMHDFVVLQPLQHTESAISAVDTASYLLKHALVK